MSVEFITRMMGMVVFTALGARVGVSSATLLGFPPETTGFLFALVGVLFGLVATPYLTLKPVVALRRAATGVPIPVLLVALVGLLAGLLLSLLVAYPLSLVRGFLGGLLPAVVSVAFGYLGMTLFAVRAREIWDFLGEQWGNVRADRAFNAGAGRELLLDTSVLIDGRIVEVAQSGFLGGTLLIPRFVLTELHQVADSADSLRRNRGQRGLAKLNELQRDAGLESRIIDDDVDGVAKVDDKLVALAIQRDAAIVTNDYNLNRVAEAQGVLVLNVNKLANAVRAAYIPGETFPIRVFQEGREADQGVGYLEDGTMVVVEQGRLYMDRTIIVEVTKLINREAGRMIFARPTEQKR